MTGIGIVTTGAPTTPSCSSTAAFPYSDPSLTGIGNNNISGVRCSGSGAIPQKFTQELLPQLQHLGFCAGADRHIRQCGSRNSAAAGVVELRCRAGQEDRDQGARSRCGCGSRRSMFSITPNSTASGRPSNGMRPNVNLSTTTGQFTGTQPARQMALSGGSSFSRALQGTLEVLQNRISFLRNRMRCLPRLQRQARPISTMN